MHILTITSQYNTWDSDYMKGINLNDRLISSHDPLDTIGIIYVHRFSLYEVGKYFDQRSRKSNFSINDQGINQLITYTLNIFPKLFLLSYFQILVKSIYSYRQYVKKYGDPDVIQAHQTLYAGLCAVIIGKLYGKKVIIFEGCSYFIRAKVSRIKRYIISKVVNNANCLIFVSKYLQDIYHEKLNIESTNYSLVIPLAIPHDIIHYSKDKDHSGNNFIFCMVSRLTREKGVDILVDSFIEAFGSNSNVELVIIGNGPHHFVSKLIHRIKNLSVNIEIINGASRGDVLDQMSSANIFVLPSLKYETFGKVIVEAHYFGMPVITTNVGGQCEIIDPSNGVLISPNSSDLTHSLKFMYGNYNTYDMDFIKKKSMNKYSPSTILLLWKCVYNTILPKINTQ
jgi:L-malate glycosyltransferase